MRKDKCDGRQSLGRCAIHTVNLMLARWNDNSCRIVCDRAVSAYFDAGYTLNNGTGTSGMRCPKTLRENDREKKCTKKNWNWTDAVCTFCSCLLFVSEVESVRVLGYKMMEINYVEVMAVIVSSLTFVARMQAKWEWMSAASRRYDDGNNIQHQQPAAYIWSLGGMKINCAVTRFEFKINAMQFYKCHT